MKKDMSGIVVTLDREDQDGTNAVESVRRYEQIQNLLEQHYDGLRFRVGSALRTLKSAPSFEAKGQAMSRAVIIIGNLVLFAAVSVAVFFLVMAIRPARAQVPQVAPGWYVTGEWQCGPHVRIVTSTDGGDGIDFLIIGAWFDNHYTLRRGQLFYNAIPCAAVGNPIGGPAPRRESRQ